MSVFTDLNKKERIQLVAELLNAEYTLKLKPSDSREDSNLPNLLSSFNSQLIGCDVFYSNTRKSSFDPIISRLAKFFKDYGVRQVFFVILQGIDRNSFKASWNSYLKSTNKEYRLTIIELFEIESISKVRPDIERDFLQQLEKDMRIPQSSVGIDNTASEGSKVTPRLKPLDWNRIILLKSSQIKRKIYAVGSSWEGDDQTLRFLEQGIWEIGADGKSIPKTAQASTHDILVLKSTFSQDKQGQFRVKAIGRVLTPDPTRGLRLEVDWFIRAGNVDISGPLSAKRKRIHQLNWGEFTSIVKALPEELVTDSIIAQEDFWRSDQASKTKGVEQAFDEHPINQEGTLTYGTFVGTEIQQYDMIFLPKSAYGGVGANGIAAHILSLLGLERTDFEFDIDELRKNRFKWFSRENGRKQVHFCFILARDEDKNFEPFAENIENAIADFLTLGEQTRDTIDKIFIPLLGSSQEGVSPRDSLAYVVQGVQSFIDNFDAIQVRVNYPREATDVQIAAFNQLVLEGLKLSEEAKAGATDQLSNRADKDLRITNELRSTVLHNDGAMAGRDLLQFDKDIRSFSIALAQKRLKPPLAVALFGNWGTGKSFFMHHLERKINYLARYQGFPKQVPTEEELARLKHKPFCEGVVQIRFNAWSYLDANLWAGLVANIFEKLDQHITGETKSDKEKLAAQKIIADKLEIVSEEKEALGKELNLLEANQAALKAEIATLEREKATLEDKAARKSIADLMAIAKRQTGALEENVKAELDKFGVSQQRIDELSPGSLLEEVSSWVTFAKHFGRLKLWHWLVISLLVAAVIVLWINPYDMVGSISQAMLTAAAAVAPVLGRAMHTFRKYKKLLAPVTQYKNDFNARFDQIKLKYNEEIASKHLSVANKREEIVEKELELKEIDRQIDDYNFALKHSITKRAFFNFIKRKANDESYEKHLGLISIIRRDFETLSALFEEVSIPDDIIGEELEELEKHQKENKEFRDLFNKPLDRIILYIDDLDRCSDEKVLEVLEAVHLLMAFPLFIVVVGVDKRCVSNALRYRNVLRYNKLTNSSSADELEEKFNIQLIEPQEYLEKIFQVPFQLKTAKAASIKSMIGTLLKNEIQEPEVIEEEEEVEGEAEKSRSFADLGLSIVRNDATLDFPTQSDEQAKESPPEPSGNEAVAEESTLVNVAPDDLLLSPSELTSLQEISELVGTAPRTIKRFINIYRIIRTHEQLQYRDGNREHDFLIVMFILALAVGKYKEVAMLLTRKANEAKMNEAEMSSDANTQSEKTSSNFEDMEAEGQEESIMTVIKVLKGHESLKPLLSVNLSRFSDYTDFVMRFTFN